MVVVVELLKKQPSRPVIVVRNKEACLRSSSRLGVRARTNQRSFSRDAAGTLLPSTHSQDGANTNARAEAGSSTAQSAA